MEAAFQSNEKKQKHGHHTDQVQDAKYTFQPMLDQSTSSVATDALTSGEQQLMDTEMTR